MAWKGRKERNTAPSINSLVPKTVITVSTAMEYDQYVTNTCRENIIQYQQNDKASVFTSESKVVKSNSNWARVFESHEPSIQFSEYSYFHQIVARWHVP